MASGSALSTLAEPVRQPLRDAAATSGTRARSDPATTASRGGRWLAISTRGTSSSGTRSRPSVSASAGSACLARSTSRAVTATGSTPLGRASEPTRRQRPPTRPISAAATVAAPVSMVKKARGSLLTPPC